MRQLRQLAVCLPLLLPYGAQAETIGPAQAQALQQQLKDWLSSIIGPSIALPDLPLRFTGEGDHYKVTLPIPGLATPSGDAAVTASVRPLDGGRWAIDDVRLPNAANFTVTLPDNSDNSAGGPTKVDLQLGKQEAHAVIDPSLATASTMQAQVAGITVVSDSPKQHQEQRIDAYKAQSSLKPAADGTLDLDMDAVMDGWRSAARTGDDTAVAIGAQRFSANGKVSGVSHERVTAVIAATSGLLAALPAHVAEKGSKTELTPADKAQVRKLIEALDGVVQSVRLEESIDGLQVEIAGAGGLSMKRFTLGFGGDAPNSRLHVWFDFGLDGLDSPSLPPKIAAFLPRHIVLRPSLSGIAPADLKKLALDATAEDPDDQDLEDDVAAMFAHGGVDLGIEALAFDLGSAKIEGKGRLTILSTESWRGDARLTATGLDDLAAQAKAHPELQQALPVLVMLRGLARPEGDRLIWDIASDKGVTTVNGIDLSQLGGDKPKGKPQGQQRNR